MRAVRRAGGARLRALDDRRLHRAAGGAVDPVPRPARRRPAGGSRAADRLLDYTLEPCLDGHGIGLPVTVTQGLISDHIHTDTRKIFQPTVVGQKSIATACDGCGEVDGIGCLESISRAGCQSPSRVPARQCNAFVESFLEEPVIVPSKSASLSRSGTYPALHIRVRSLATSTAPVVEKRSSTRAANPGDCSTA